MEAEHTEGETWHCMLNTSLFCAAWVIGIYPNESRGHFHLDATCYSMTTALLHVHLL